MTHSCPTRRSSDLVFFGVWCACRPAVFPGFRPVVPALCNTRTFTSAAAQIIKFRPPHDTATDDSNRIDIGRIERENTLNAFPEADLPHGAAGAKGPVGTGDTNASILLHTGTLTFDDAPAHAERVARAGIRNGTPEQRRDGKKRG